MLPGNYHRVGTIALYAVAFLYWGPLQTWAGDRLVYENSLGYTPEPLSPGELYADDLYTTAIPGCALSRYEFQLRTDSPVKLDISLYASCPISGGVPIEGTQRQVFIDQAGAQWIAVEVPPEVSIPIPNVLWLGIIADAAAEWVGGAPAIVGYSDEVFVHPQRGCATSNGTYPVFPHASFNVRVYVREPCASAFLGYRLSAPIVSSYSPGAGIRMADDLRLIVPQCELLGYETLLRSSGEFQVDLRLPDTVTGFPGSIIPGTQASFLSSGGVRFFRYFLSEPVSTGDKIWLTVQGSTISARAVLGFRPPRAGQTEPSIAVETPQGWELRNLTAEQSNGGLHIAIWCAGEAPVGACCDMYFTDKIGDAICREVPEINCPYPGAGFPLLPKWKPESTCAQDPFDPPCGTSACCRADGTCENRLPSQCVAGSVAWHLGRYCGDPSVVCEEVCVISEDLCTLPHPSIGCADPFCCQSVCEAGEIGGYCCVVEWDQTCVQLAAELCEIPPPNDECAAIPRSNILGATMVTIPGSAESDGLHATENPLDPRFCCNAAGHESPAYGTVWYKFVAPDESVEISTCRSNAPAQDSLIQVFAVGNAGSDQTACASLRPIHCADDASGCSDTQANSWLCLTDLAPGQTYYILVGAKTPETRGVYLLDFQIGCTPEKQTCPCPAGAVEFLDPPGDWVDPRRPFDPDLPTQPLGLDRLRVTAPVGSERTDCWRACGTGVDDQPNSIQHFFPQADGSTTVTFRAPLKPLSQTILFYRDGDGMESTGRFIFHPGDVDADHVSTPSDVVDLLQIVQRGAPEDLSPLRFDIDRSGIVSPLDLVDLIDLLNGAGAFEPWIGTSLIPSEQCP